MVQTPTMTKARVLHAMTAQCRRGFVVFALLCAVFAMVLPTSLAVAQHTDTVVAVVNGKKISKLEFDLKFREVFYHAPKTKDMDKAKAIMQGKVDKIIGKLVNEELMSQEAERLRLFLCSLEATC